MWIKSFQPQTNEDEWKDEENSRINLMIYCDVSNPQKEKFRRYRDIREPYESNYKLKREVKNHSVDIHISVVN